MRRGPDDGQTEFLGAWIPTLSHFFREILREISEKINLYFYFC